MYKFKSIEAYYNPNSRFWLTEVHNETAKIYCLFLWHLFIAVFLSNPYYQVRKDKT